MAALLDHLKAFTGRFQTNFWWWIWICELLRKGSRVDFYRFDRQKFGGTFDTRHSFIHSFISLALFLNFEIKFWITYRHVSILNHKIYASIKILILCFHENFDLILRFLLWGWKTYDFKAFLLEQNENLVSINKLWQSLIGWPLTLRRVNLV